MSQDDNPYAVVLLLYDSYFECEWRLFEFAHAYCQKMKFNQRHAFICYCTLSSKRRILLYHRFLIGLAFAKTK